CSILIKNKLFPFIQKENELVISKKFYNENKFCYRFLNDTSYICTIQNNRQLLLKEKPTFVQ
ncbi:MAG: hypothetical protein AAGJ18_12755, partial [Bacteroidota bacterium]